MRRPITFDELKELYEFSLSSNGLKVPRDGPDAEVAGAALRSVYDCYLSIWTEGGQAETEAALLAILAVTFVNSALIDHRRNVDSLKS